MKQLLGNVLLFLASLAVILLLFEFGVFRFILPASDLPDATFVDGVVRLTPGQSGTFRVMDEIAAPYRINAQGWNSGHARYERDKKPGTSRIAVIGDSYVEALRVDYRKSIGEVLEARLGKGFEVYRFGISGAPLSQYLHMMRHEVMAYHPDVVAVVLVHNDFQESYAFKAGTRASAFLKLTVEDGEVTGETAPSGLPRQWFDPLRRTAIWRYLGVRRGLRFQAVRDLLLGPDEAPKAMHEAKLEANIDTTRLEADEPDPLRDDRAATRHVLRQMQELTARSGARLILVMDGVRSLIEQDSLAIMDYTRGALRLNKMVRQVAGELSIPYLDLHPVFVADFGQHHEPFAFPHDGHWNEHANALAADALAEALRAHHLLP